jgi:uncharacterized protein (TIGR02646 family)
MKDQFESFYLTLNFKKNKRNEIRRVLNDLYKKSEKKSIDVWTVLYNLKIPAREGIGKIEGVQIISKLRDFLAKKQNYRCCYCQRYLYNIAYSRPIEHILPRSKYPRFSLVLYNLAISCYDCNHKKSDNVWWPEITNKGSYPLKSDLDGAFHYNHHNYDEHISWVGYSSNNFAFTIYNGITDEGRKLYQDLLRDISRTDILLSRNDNFKPSLENLKLLREKGLGGKEVQEFINDLQSKIISSAIFR